MVAPLILAGMLASAGAWAGSAPEAALAADWAKRSAQASELNRQARALRDTAEQRYLEQEKGCYAKFMVNNCLDAAKKERIPKVNEARRLEIEAKQIEREVRQEQFVDRDQRNAVELREREASLPQREEKAAAASEKHEAEVEANSRKKAQQAAEGERRRVEREARIAKKRADHEAKVAEKMRAADHRSTPGN